MSEMTREGAHVLSTGIPRPAPGRWLSAHVWRMCLFGRDSR